MRKISWILAFTGIALFLVSCTNPQSKNGTNSSINTGQVGSYLAGIKTVKARIAPLTRQITMPGQVSATENGKVDVTTPLNGVILRSFVKLGESVAAGEPIAVVNSVYGQTTLQILQKLEADEAAVSQARDNAAQAQAELANANIALRRERALFRGGVAARSDVQDAHERYLKAAAVWRDTANLLALAQAALSRDKAIFRQSKLSGAALPQNLTPVPLSEKEKYPAAPGSVLFYVRAPISGTVTAYAISPGFSVTPGTVLATITNTSEVYVDGNAYESDLPFVNEGDPLTAQVASFPGELFHGVVKYVGKQVDPATRTVMVRSLMENTTGILRPGMFATLTLSAARPRMAVVVPDSAVLIHGNKNYLFVETSPGHFEKRSVRVGLTAAGETQILSGVKPGESVVTSGNLLLEGQE